MTSANTTHRVIEIDGARPHADVRSGAAPALVFLHYHLSPLEVPDQVARHITRFTARLNELPPH